MKNNNKNRKLERIRKKNAFRILGFTQGLKVSRQMLEEVGKNGIIDMLVLASQSTRYRNYKTICDIESFMIDFCGDDFIHDRLTATIRGKIAKV